MRGALTKPLLVVRGHPRPGLTSSTGHHVGHEVTGWQQGGNNLTGLLCLLTTQLARANREARGDSGELADILSHLSALQQQYSVPAGAGAGAGAGRHQRIIRVEILFSEILHVKTGDDTLKVYDECEVEWRNT